MLPRKKSMPHTATRVVPRALMRLPFPFQHALKHLAPLLSLPDLIGILVLIEFQEFLVSLQSGLGLVQLIVANRADKPDARSGLFHFGYLVHGCECSGIIPCQEKGRAEVFEVSQILRIEMERGS